MFLVAAFSLSAMAQIDPTDIGKPKFTTIRKIVIINGNVPWKSAGVVLKSTDYVAITAAGEVRFNAPEPNSAVSPNGLGQMSYKKVWTGDAQHCDDPYGKINHAALIAKVGDNGFPFLLGEEKSLSNKEGELFIGINDCTFIGPYPNSGQFSVVLIITRLKTGGLKKVNSK